MPEYLDIEAQVEGDEQQDFEQHDDELSDNDNLIIDDNVEGNDLSFYRSIDNQLENVGDIETILQQELNEQY